MGVTLSGVKRAAKAHRAALAGESAGYLVLAIADQLLSAPRLVQAADVELTEDGGLRVLGHASSEVEAEVGLRQALDALLLVASSGSAALTRASRRTVPVGLAGLVRELEAALIPVNRAAARRTLARLYRETARAVHSGVLPAEVPPAALTPELELEPSPAVAADRAPALPPVAVAEAAPEAETREPPDALAPEPETALDEDVQIAVIDSESEAAPTVVRDAPVARRSATRVDEARTEMPVEACTRPEPVVLRRSRLPEPALAAPLSGALSPLSEPFPHTPTLGSLAALPVLSPQLIAELDAIARHAEQAACCEWAPECAPAQSSATQLMVCSAPIEECTEPMPEVDPLGARVGAALVTSRKSELSELVSSFQVTDADSNPGLCRAIKEMAGLDLTPAPFAVLIR